MHYRVLSLQANLLLILPLAFLATVFGNDVFLSLYSVNFLKTSRKGFYSEIENSPSFQLLPRTSSLISSAIKLQTLTFRPLLGLMKKNKFLRGIFSPAFIVSELSSKFLLWAPFYSSSKVKLLARCTKAPFFQK